MLKVRSLFLLIRWPNLIFIAITQLLFYYCILLPHLDAPENQQNLEFSTGVLWMILFASLFIAAGGYIINDYFDINIDRVNKPGKMVLEKYLSRRSAIIFHLFFTLGGLLLSAWAALHTSWLVLMMNAICAALLWFYSTTFKRQPLIGNLIISLLTAWVILVLYVAVNNDHIRLYPSRGNDDAIKGVFKYSFLYAGFAFIISLIREVIKDIEDIHGDERYHCSTMPIVWGISGTRIFAGVWMVVLTAVISVLVGYLLLIGWWLSAAYTLALLIMPLLYVHRLLYQAKKSSDYHRISSLLKLIMLLGIFSMITIAFHLKQG